MAQGSRRQPCKPGNSKYPAVETLANEGSNMAKKKKKAKKAKA
jgi:hypothetical protein